MQAVVEIAGKQFNVAQNDKIKVPLLSLKEGEKISFDKVHMLEDDKGKITFGKPLVSNTAVNATVLEHGRDKKIIVFKKKRRKGYQKKNGHRQDFSLIEINSIGAAKTAAKKAAAEKPVKKEEKATAAKAETKTVKKAAPKKAEAAETKKTTTAKKATATKKETASKPKTAPKKSAASDKPKTAAKQQAKPKTTKSTTAAKKTETKSKARED